MRNQRVMVLVLAMLGAVTFACSAEVVRIALDWTPNTNHTGLFVAMELGFFADEGLDVRVLEPGPVVAIHLVAAGHAEFGIASQEYITMARAQDVPVVSIATVFQHNTSGFAAPLDRNIVSPRDFAGRRYGGWGSEMEEAMIRTVMEREGADFATVSMINIGMIDFTTAIRQDLADFFWIFYGWQGIHAELQGLDITFMPLPKLDEVLDYYTPLIFTSEEMIRARPETVRRFLRALARGYVYAAQHPVLAARILLRVAPELDPDLVLISQAWLAGQSETEITAWGRQDPHVWDRFARWALENGMIERPIVPEGAFTNAFLPE
ncbi:TPA: ABC transporter substrate-binding protein [Candidatus Acetothermia bacterium]|nr:ABC transporter substrate-binding protein [Candidatus Acetothermia bacterium]